MSRNNLGITKAQGRACLKELETHVWEEEATRAIDKLLGSEGDYGAWPSFGRNDAFLTALAMCAAIAGVEP